MAKVSCALQPVLTTASLIVDTLLDAMVAVCPNSADQTLDLLNYHNWFIIHETHNVPGALHALPLTAQLSEAKFDK